MPRYDAECRVLKWAAGLFNELPQDTDFDENVLLEAVQEHRLVRRFLERVQSQNPRVFSTYLLEKLQEGLQREENRFQAHTHVLQEISKSIPANEEPLIVIKGLSLYVLTGQKHYLRLSHDIDILPKNSKRFLSMMFSMGYKKEKTTIHEEARLDCDGLKIDIHNYFPIWSYPEEMKTCMPDPSRAPKVWLQNSTIIDNQLRYEQLVKYSVSGTSQIAEHVLVPSLEAAALIFCGHILRMYAFFPLSMPMGTVRLAELADFFEVICSSDFDDTRFCKLVGDVNGQDSVALSLLLLTDYLNGVSSGRMNDLLGKLRSTYPAGWSLSERFPRQLWEGFWAVVRQETDDLLIRSTTMGDLVDQLGYTKIPLSSAGTSDMYTTSWFGAQKQLDRTMLRRANAEEFPARFSFALTEDMLHFVILLPRTTRDMVDRIRLDFGDVFCEVIYKPWNESCSLESWPILHGKATVEQHPDDYLLEVELQWSEVEDAISWDRKVRDEGGSKSVPLWVGVLRQNTNMTNTLFGFIAPVWLKSQ